MKILIADDERDIADSYKSALESRGHKITATSNGLECVQEYRSQIDGSKPPFDVVILDYRMPQMNGFEAAKLIRESIPEQRIIFASAYSRETLSELIQKHGMLAELLQKPFGRQELFDTIEDTYIYSQLQKLTVDVGDLKKWNLTHAQLSDLLDGILRLKDPRATFDRVFASAGITERKELDSASKGQQVGDDAIAAIIDEAIRFLGPDSVSVLYYHLAKMGIEKQAIAINADHFVEALDRIFIGASSIVQMRILKAIEEKYDLSDTTSAIAKFAATLRKTKVPAHNGRKES